jgi:hypothetical protein
MREGCLRTGRKALFIDLKWCLCFGLGDLIIVLPLVSDSSTMVTSQDKES